MDEPIVWYEGAGTSDRCHLVTDHQGSVIAAAGSGATRYAYGPYGEPDTWSGSRFRYTGQAALPEVGLYHYKARVYDPVLGRFLQTDPIGYEDGLNWYAYVQSDPLNRTDPSGRDGLLFGVEGWNVGDRDMVTGEALPPAYTGLGFAAGFNENGDFEIGGFISHAEGSNVVGTGSGILAGPGIYHGDIQSMETTTHTAIGGVGAEGGSVTVKMEGNKPSTDAASASLPRAKPAAGIGVGGAVARPTTRTVSAVVLTRGQIENARREIGEAASGAANAAANTAKQASEFVRTLPDRIREGLPGPNRR